MALHEQVSKLVERLKRLSAEGKVDWEETADEDTFQAAVSKFVVTVSRIGPRSDPSYRITIRDQTGKVIEEATAYSGQEWGQLSDIHDLARRRALHVDEALSELLSSLE
jgi:hypothetical protein